MRFYQWLVPLIALAYIVRIVSQYRMQKRLLGSTIIWTVFWLGVVLLAILPDYVSINIARLLGFESNINAVIFTSLGFLFFFLIYITATVDRLEKQMTGVIRKLALDNQELKERLAALEHPSHENITDS